MNSRDLVAKFGHLLRLPWHSHETPESYYDKHLQSLHAFREHQGLAVVMDILQARQRQIWSAFESLKEADAAKLADLHSRASEVAFLAVLLDGKGTELSRRATENARAAEKEAQQGRMALDHVLSGRKRPLANTQPVV